MSITKRFYFNVVDHGALVETAFGSSWTDVAGYSRNLLSETKRPDVPELEQSRLDVWGSTLDKVPIGSQYQFSNVFPVGEIEGGFTFVTYASKTNNTGVLDVWVRIALYTAEGSLKGVLFDDIPNGTPPGTSKEARTYTGTFASGIVAAEGDIMTFGRGARFQDTAQWSSAMSLYIRDSEAVADLPYGDGPVAQGNPWLNIYMVEPLPPEEPEPPVIVEPITWDKSDERYYSTGVDRGVLYPKNGSAVPWNGIIGVTESGAGDTSVLYRDGHVYYADVEPGDYSGTLSAFFWPREFSECLGMPEIAPGFQADYQKPKRFDLSYRSLIGSGSAGDMFGYQIHLIYNAICSVDQRSRKTMTNSPALDEFGFSLVATPRRIKGYRPTAHFIIDTRFLSSDQIAALEDGLYGSDPQLPDPEYVYELLKFGDEIQFEDLGEGRIRATGSSTNIVKTSYGSIKINNVNGTVVGDGSLILEDTP